MKKLFYMISAVALVASFAACNKMEQGNDPVSDGPQVETPSADGTVTLNVLAAAPQTKVYMNDGHTLWVKDDVITVFAEDGASAVSEPVSAAAPAYNFTVPEWNADKTPSIAVATGSTSYFSYYKNLAYTERVIRAKLRPEQALYHKNTFGKLANIAVGELACKEEGVYSTTMRNLCGLIGFKVAGDNVRKVVISDRDGKALTGEIDMVMTQEGEINVPTVKEVVNGVSSVTIYAVKSDNLNGGSGLLPAGSTYYACVLPGEYNLVVEAYSKGEDIDNNEDDVLLNTLTAKEPMTIARNQYRTIDVPVDTYKPADIKTLTIDFSASWPFSPDLAAGSSVKIKTKDAYTFTQDGEEYSIEIYAPQTGYYNTGSALRFQGTGGGYITTPAIQDYKLMGIAINLTNAVDSSTGANKVMNICSEVTVKDDQSDVWVDTDATIKTLTINTKNTNEGSWNDIAGTSANTSYYLFTESNHYQLGKLVLTYTKVN